MPCSSCGTEVVGPAPAAGASSSGTDLTAEARCPECGAVLRPEASELLFLEGIRKLARFGLASHSHLLVEAGKGR